MDLIDRECLRECMYHAAFEEESDLQKWDSGCWIRYKLFEKILDQQLSVTIPEERPKGEWITDNTNKQIAKCKNCGLRWSRIEVNMHFNFCPSCGAETR